MVEAITLRIDRRSISSFNGMLGRLGRVPDMASSAMFQWGKILEREMVLSARNSGIQKWRGKLFNGIKWRQKPKGRIGRLFMPLHGIYLDSMRTHVVALKRGRLITSWASDKGVKGFRLSDGTRAIRVRKHPFIRKGYMMARPHLNTLLKQKIKIGGTT